MKPQKGTKFTKIENGMQQNQVGNEGRVGIDDLRLQIEGQSNGDVVTFWLYLARITQMTLFFILVVALRI
jgi:hypothetical protein